VQTSPAWGDVSGNLESIEGMLAEAPAFDVAVLPELCTTGYQFRSREELLGLAEEIPGPSTEAFAAIASRKGAFVVAGLAERSGERPYNSAIVVGPGGLIGRYRKVHLFDREKLVFEPGDMGFPTWEIEGAFGKAELGVMVCYDWLYPEAARSLALAGADLVAHPSNLVLPYCPDAMITRCLENRVHAATANRVGGEDRWSDGPGLRFIGRSQVVDARGRRVAALGEAETGVAVASLDVAAARDKRPTQRNELWQDLRPGAYRREPLP
jgi:predicted amidohydrolase